jgi:hypothetical protein
MLTNLQLEAFRLHNALMSGQTMWMAQNDKDPPPIVTMNAPPPIADAQAQADRDWQLIEAEEQSKKLQASFVNRAFVKVEARNLRIAFGERVGDEDIYRSAIVMTPEDAYELGQLLLKQAGAAYGVVLEHYRQVLEGLEDDEGPVDG